MSTYITIPNVVVTEIGIHFGEFVVSMENQYYDSHEEQGRIAGVMPQPKLLVYISCRNHGIHLDCVTKEVEVEDFSYTKSTMKKFTICDGWSYSGGIDAIKGLLHLVWINRHALSELYCEEDILDVMNTWHDYQFHAWDPKTNDFYVDKSQLQQLKRDIIGFKMRLDTALSHGERGDIEGEIQWRENVIAEYGV